MGIHSYALCSTNFSHSELALEAAVLENLTCKAILGMHGGCFSNINLCMDCGHHSKWRLLNRSMYAHHNPTFHCEGLLYLSVKCLTYCFISYCELYLVFGYLIDNIFAGDDIIIPLYHPRLTRC